MGELHVRAMLAGLVFAVWPLFMNRSGLGPNVASGIFATLSLIVVMPFTLYSMRGMDWSVHWYMGIIAGLFGGLGLLIFNSVLFKATPQNVGNFFTLVLIMQVVVSAAYQTYMNGGLTIFKGIGFATAILAAILLA